MDESRKKKLIIVVAICTIAIFLLITIAVTLQGDELKIITKKEWGSRNATIVVPFDKTPRMIIISHTATVGCEVKEECEVVLRDIQSVHMNGRNWSDIGFNFLVGGDGNAYEGRGAAAVGAHTKGYNSVALGVALVGSFNNISPSPQQLATTQKLIAYLRARALIVDDYELYGQRQLSVTDSPGSRVFEAIERWPHFHAGPVSDAPRNSSQS